MIKKLVRAELLLSNKKVADHSLVDYLLRQYWPSHKVSLACDKISPMLTPLSLCAVASLISVKLALHLSYSILNI